MERCDSAFLELGRFERKLARKKAERAAMERVGPFRWTTEYRVICGEIAEIEFEIGRLLAYVQAKCVASDRGGKE